MSVRPNYTVLFEPAATAGLADAWLRSVDRKAVTEASDDAERLLAERPLAVGVEVHEGLRRLDQPPLRRLYEVRDADRKVLVTGLRLLPNRARGEQHGSNGRPAA